MSFEIKLPELGESIVSADVIKILVSENETVVIEQPLLELETDKATFEVPSPISGTIMKILVKEGEIAQVGQTIFLVEETAEVKEKEERAIDVSEATSAPSTESSQSDIVKETAEDEMQEKTESQAPDRALTEEPEERALFPPAPASPSVRRTARELGVDIGLVKGTGPGGRISAEDVKEFVRTTVSSSIIHAFPQTGIQTALPDFSNWGEVERVPMSNVRRKTAENMQSAWLTVPSVTQNDKADITSLEEFRSRYAEKAAEAGGKLTLTAILLKITASALKRYPQFNAGIDMAKREIVYKKYYNVGVAVDTDRGLLVPVIRDVDRKNIIELSVDLSQMSAKARNKKLAPEEMQGGTFTITNLGGISGTSFTPIVNAPEVAILGISRATMEPLYIEGTFEPRLMLPLSLTYDHRLIDGADGARFLRWICEALEQPFLLTLEG